ncbi:MAG: type IV pilin N-terminal domain-containing protein [Candidatus Kariarchaeaceae archaeon]
MRFSVYLRNRRRAVSPVISSLLLIALAIAGASTVAIIMSNSQDTAPTIDSSLNIGSSSGSTYKGTLTLEGLTKDPILFQEGINDYVRITVKLDYTGDYDKIYAMDLDIHEYGVKLDDFSQWSVVKAEDAETGNPLPIISDSNGNFLGYEQSKGTSALYTVEVTDRSIELGRLEKDAAFTYVLKVGSEPGIISHLFSNEELSKTVFNVIWYKVAIIHDGQDSGDTATALSQWQTTLRDINGTNRAFFNYTETRDAYDSSLGPINGTALGEEYDIVISAEWAIQPSLSTTFSEIHSSNSSLIFYGSIIPNSIYQNFNATASAEISGVIPSPNPANIPSGLIGSLFYTSDNSYTFNSTNDMLLLTLSGQSGTPDDIQAYDAATLASGYGLSTYAEITYDVNRRWGQGNRDVFDHTGPLLVLKSENFTAGTGRTITFTGNHQVILASHGDALRRNMVFKIIESTERLSETTGEFHFNSFEVGRFWRFVFFDATGSVTGGDILDNTLQLTFMFEGNFDWNSFNGQADITVGSTTINNLPFTIDNSGVNDTIFIDIGANYVGNIVEGSTIHISFTQLLRRNNNRIPDDYDWRVDAVYQDLVGAIKDTHLIQAATN